MSIGGLLVRRNYLCFCHNAEICNVGNVILKVSIRD